MVRGFFFHLLRLSSDLFRAMEGLRISEEEDIEFADGVNDNVVVDQSLCLVSRFLTDRSIRAQIMKDRIADIWRC